MQNTINTSISTDKVTLWFEELIQSLNADLLMLQTRTAPVEVMDFYNKVISAGASEIHQMALTQGSMFFIQNIVQDFVKELIQSIHKPLQIALDFSNSKVLAWIEINDDDEKAEDNIIMTEARINAKYHDFGFHLTSTIIEKSDNLDVPPHYRPLKF